MLTNYTTTAFVLLMFACAFNRDKNTLNRENDQGLIFRFHPVLQIFKIGTLVGLAAHLYDPIFRAKTGTSQAIGYGGCHFPSDNRTATACIWGSSPPIMPKLT